MDSPAIGRDALPRQHFAMLCAAAYDPRTTPDLQLGTSELYFSEWQGVQVVTWRGSDGLADWLVDLAAVPAYSAELGCRVHGGFLQDFRETAWDLSAWLRRTPGPVILAGHSKGAATATLAGAMMIRRGRPPLALITFGSPRVGFTGLERLYRGVAVRRYVHGADAITRVPCLLPWRHVAPPIPIGVPGDPVRDHDIAGYCAAPDSPPDSIVNGGSSP